MVTQTLPSLVLIEDCEDDERMSMLGISRSGVRCSVAIRRDGVEALELLLAYDAPQPALVLLDYVLPKLDGLEVLTRLRAHNGRKQVPVVVFSGTNDGQQLEECYRMGANSCVSKPSDAAEYMDCLAQITRYWLLVNRPYSGQSGPIN